MDRNRRQTFQELQSKAPCECVTLRVVRSAQNVSCWESTTRSPRLLLPCWKVHRINKYKCFVNISCILLLRYKIYCSTAYVWLSSPCSMTDSQKLSMHSVLVATLPSLFVGFKSQFRQSSFTTEPLSKAFNSQLFQEQTEPTFIRCTSLWIKVSPN